jgi:hypothetical protein
LFCNLIVKLLVVIADIEAALNSVDPAVQAVDLIAQSLNLPFQAVESVVKLASAAGISAARISAARVSSTGESAASAWQAGNRDVQALSLLSMVHSGHLLII